MADNATVVTYDISQAMTRLEQLAQKLEDVADRTQDNFDRAEASTGKWEKKLAILSPRLTGILGDVRTLTAGVTDFGIGVGVAGAAAGIAIGAVAAQFIDFNELVKDSTAQIEAFQDQVSTGFNLRKGAEGVRDAFELEKFDTRLEDIRDQQAGIAESTAAIGREKAGLEDRLSANKSYYTQLTQLAKSSAREREAIEKRLEGIQERKFLRGIDKLPVEFQLKKLTDEIGRRRQGGDLEGAERLLQQAQSIQDSSGSAFQSRQLADEENKLIEALGKKQTELKSAEDAANKEAEATRNNATALQEQLDLLKATTQELGRQRKELQAAGKRVGLARETFQENVVARTSAQERDEAVRKINAERFVERSFAQKQVDQFKFGFDSLSPSGAGGAGIAEQNKLVVAGKVLIQAYFNELKKGTAEADTNASGILEKLNRINGALKQDPSRSTAFDFDVAQFDRVIAQGNIVNEANRKRAGSERAFDSQITIEPQQTADLALEATNVGNNFGIAADNAERMAAGVERARKALDGANVSIPSIGTGLPTRQASGQAAPAGTTNQQNVNVQMDIKANTVDEAFIRQVTERVRREIRRDTTPKAQ